jgi:hypothetical protein
MGERTPGTHPWATVWPVVIAASRWHWCQAIGATKADGESPGSAIYERRGFSSRVSIASIRRRFAPLGSICHDRAP